MRVLRPLAATCARFSAIVHGGGLFGPFCEGNFRRKPMTGVGNSGQLGTSTLSPHFFSVATQVV